MLLQSFLCLILAIALISLLHLTVAQDADPAPLSQVLYVDASLQAEVNATRDCTLQYDPCSTIQEALKKANATQSVTIRLTWLAGLTSAGVASLSSLRNTSDAVGNLTWTRVSSLLSTDVNLYNSYNHVGATILLNVPWRCDDFGDAVTLPNVVQPNNSVALLFEPDPALHSLIFAPQLHNGSSADILGANTMGAGLETVMINFIWSTDPYGQAARTCFGRVQDYNDVALFSVSNAHINLFGFVDVSASLALTTSYFGPISIQQESLVALSVTNSTFIRSSAVYCGRSVVGPYITTEAQTVAFTKVSSLGHTRLIVFDITSAASVSLDRILYVDDGKKLLYTQDGSVISVQQQLYQMSLSVTNSVFKNSTMPSLINAGFVTFVTLDGLVVQDCVNPSTPIVLNKAYQAIIKDSNFTRNTRGVIDATGLGVLQIYSCRFEGNGVLQVDSQGLNPRGGAALYAYGQFFAVVTNSFFIGNVATGNGGAIQVSLGIQLSVTGSIFDSNLSLYGNGGAIAQDTGAFSISSNTFVNCMSREGSGGAIYLSNIDDQNPGVQRSQFQNCRAALSGGAIELRYVRTLTMGKVSIIGCTAKYGGSLRQINSYSIIQDSSTVQNSSAEYGGFVELEGFSGFVARKTTFNGVRATYGGLGSFQDISLLVLDSTSIKNAEAAAGAVAYFAPGQLQHRPWVASTKILPILSDIYSPGQLVNSLPFSKQRYLKVTGLAVRSSAASQSGDLFACSEQDCLDWPTLENEGNISLSFDPTEKPPVSLETAVWSSSDPRIVKIRSVTLNGMGRSVNSTEIDRDSLFLDPVQIYPGQSFDILAEMFDFYDSKVKSYPGAQVKLDVFYPSGQSQRPQLVPSGLQISPSLDVLDGTIAFHNLHITGQPGFLVYISLSFVIASTNQVTEERLTVQLAQCPLGFAIDSSGICIQCSGPLLYSITPGATSCSTCPEHAICDTDSIQSVDGFYLVSSGSNASFAAAVTRNFETSVTNSSSVQVQLIRCPNDYCLQGNKCTSNRDGLLCGACKDGYSEWSGQCFACHKGQSNGGLVFFWLVYLFVMFLVQHLSSQSPRSGSIKILYFFTQIFLLVAGPSSTTLLTWAKGLFSLDILVGSGQQGITCPFERSNTGRMLTNLFQPVAFILIVVLLFIPSQLTRLTIYLVQRTRKRSQENNAEESNAGVTKDKKVEEEKAPAVVVEMQSPGAPSTDTLDELTGPTNQAARRSSSKMIFQGKITRKTILQKLRNKTYKLLFGTSTWIRSLLNMVVLSFTILTTASFQWFACRQIGEQNVLISATDISCGSAEYQQLTWLFVLGCIYVCALPLLFLILLTILRLANRLQHHDTKRFLGTLYISYKPWCQWWYEPYALSRRLVIVLLVVFLGHNQDVLWPVLLVALLLFQIIQFICRPYVSWIENIAEELSLSSLVLITAINMLSTSSSSTGGGVSIGAMSATQATISGISLAIFLVSLFTIIFALVANHWITHLILDALDLKSKMQKLAAVVIKRRKE